MGDLATRASGSAVADSGGVTRSNAATGRVAGGRDMGRTGRGSGTHQGGWGEEAGSSRRRGGGRTTAALDLDWGRSPLPLAVSLGGHAGSSSRGVGGSGSVRVGTVVASGESNVAWGARCCASIRVRGAAGASFCAGRGSR